MRYINQSINQSTLFQNSIHPYIQILLSNKKTKLTRMHVHIAKVSNAGAMGKCICGHFQQCSAILYCMTSL